MFLFETTWAKKTIHCVWVSDTAANFLEMLIFWKIMCWTVVLVRTHTKSQCMHKICMKYDPIKRSSVSFFCFSPVEIQDGGDDFENFWSLVVVGHDVADCYVRRFLSKSEHRVSELCRTHTWTYGCNTHGTSMGTIHLSRNLADAHALYIASIR